MGKKITGPGGPGGDREEFLSRCSSTLSVPKSITEAQATEPLNLVEILLRARVRQPNDLWT